MRWEMLEQQSERERESVICIRIEQTRSEDSVDNRQTSARAVEEDILTLVNLIREQYFQQAETFISGDIRYQGFEDQDGLGKGMITMRRRKVEMFEIDIALGCLLGFYLGNGIQANSGRAYKWCPFWGKMGITTARVTSITRANDYYSKVSNSSDLWKSNQRAQGIGHKEPQVVIGKANASTATTASRIRTSTRVAQDASMMITSKNVQKGAVERPGSGCPGSSIVFCG